MSPLPPELAALDHDPDGTRFFTGLLNASLISAVFWGAVFLALT